MEGEIQETSKLLINKVSSWYTSGISLLPNFVSAIVIIVAFYFIAKLIRYLTRKALEKSIENQATLRLLTTTTYIFILAIGFFTALEVMKLDKTVTSLLAGAGVLGLALGFALQEIAQNLVSGILITFYKPYKINDVVKVGEVFGVVVDINLRSTSIMNFEQLEVIVPNRDMFTKEVTNYTTTPIRRIEIQVGVSYGDNLEKAQRLVYEALDKVPEKNKNYEPEVYFTGFGNSSIDLIAFLYIDYPGKQNYFKSIDTSVKNIKKAFDENGITIPFPIRTLDFGIKGGEKIDQRLGELPAFSQRQ